MIQHGQVRTIRKFLWLPRRVHGRWRWLRLVNVRQEMVVWPDVDGDWWAWVDREVV